MVHGFSKQASRSLKFGYCSVTKTANVVICTMVYVHGRSRGEACYCHNIDAKKNKEENGKKPKTLRINNQMALSCIVFRCRMKATSYTLAEGM